MDNTYNPNPVSFFYQPNAPQQVTGISIAFKNNSEVIFNNNNIQIIGLPAWLTVKNIVNYLPGNNVFFTLEVNQNFAIGLLPGNYTGTVYVRYDNTYTDPIGLTVNLTVSLAIYLTITPTPIVFNWVIGSAFPANKLFQITSGSNWTIESPQSWIVLAAASGIGNSSLAVGVDPTGLPIGDYEGIVNITDNQLTRSAVVILSITEGDTETDYLYLNPRNFEFISELEVENTKQIPINLDVSGNWTAVPSEDWIVISEESGIAGIQDLDISVDSVLLPIGTYSGFITFTCADIVKKVYIILKVIEFYTRGIESNTLYFADDRNTLEVTATTDNTWLVLDTVAATGEDNITYEQEAPYMQGIAKLIIGQETNNFLRSVVPTNVLTSRIINNIKPINIGFTAFNVNKFTDAVSQIAVFQNLYFLRGKTPLVTNKLCYIPSDISVTNKAILSLSLLATSSPGTISITGDVTATIATSLPNDLYVYNGIVNLSTLGLVAGNAITITFGTLVVNVSIKANEPEEQLLAYENEWGEYEFINTTGYLTKAPSITDTQTKIAVEGKELTKIVSIDYGIDYTLNTGFILSEAEIEWLALILKAKRKFIYVDGEPIEIILTTKKLETYQTREHTRSFNLSFKRALV